jgi:hypothetical protein
MNNEDQAIGFDKYGALLAAVAHVMMTQNVSAVAARAGHYDEQLVAHMVGNGLDGVEAQRMLEVELSEAVNIQ